MNIEDEYPSGEYKFMQEEYERKKQARKELLADNKNTTRHTSTDKLSEIPSKQDNLPTEIYTSDCAPISNKDNKCQSATSFSESELLAITQELKEICKSDCEILMPSEIYLTPRSQHPDPLFWIDKLDNDDGEISEFLLSVIDEFKDMPLYTYGFDYSEMYEWFINDCPHTRTKWHDYSSEAHPLDANNSLNYAFQIIREEHPSAFHKSDRKLIIIRISRTFSAKLELFRSAHTVIDQYFRSCLDSDSDCLVTYAIAEDAKLIGTTALAVDIYSGKIGIIKSKWRQMYGI